MSLDENACIRSYLTMFAEAFSKRLAARGVHYGWAIVAVTFLTSLTTAGAVGIPGVLIAPLTKEFGWNTSQISSALALRLLLFGLMGPFSAALLERYGVRRVVLTAISLILAGLISAALFMTRLWELVLLWGVVIGVATGMTAVVLGAIVSGRWFVVHRGLVMGLLTASNAAGQLVFLPLVAWLVGHVGWRLALTPAICGLVLAGGAVALLMRDKPADVGLLPFGATERSEPPLSSTKGGAIERAFSTLGEASRVPAFWLLFATFFICGTSTNGLVQTHFIPLCMDYGMQAVAAASVLAMMGAFDFFGTIGSGWLSDRIDPRFLLFWYYGLRGLSLLYLPHATFSVYGLSLFAVFYGLDWIATVPPTVRLVAQNFGRERAGIVFGWIFAGHQIGAAAAAFGAGFVRTQYLTYVPAFLTAGALCVVAAFLMFGLAAPQVAEAAPAAAE
jgi:sugar phosphate permease